MMIISYSHLYNPVKREGGLKWLEGDKCLHFWIAFSSPYPEVSLCLRVYRLESFVLGSTERERERVCVPVIPRLFVLYFSLCVIIRLYVWVYVIY